MDNRESAPSEQKSYEEKIRELEALVRQMESGSLPLNDMLIAYDTGMKLSRELSADLDQAEQKMLELSNQELKPMEDLP